MVKLLNFAVPQHNGALRSIFEGFKRDNSWQSIRAAVGLPQWLRLCSQGRGHSSIPAQETKVAWCGQKKKKERAAAMITNISNINC